jgi:hypothetical protein
MSYLFFFLTGLAGLLLIIGLVQPGTYNRFFKGAATKSKVAKWLGSATGVFFVLWIVFVMVEADPKPAPTQTPTPVAQEQNNAAANNATNSSANTPAPIENKTPENKPAAPTPKPSPKPPSTIDQLWSTLDTSMKTREHYDVKYDGGQKQAYVIFDASDETVWDETALVRDAYELLVKYGREAFKVNGVDEVRVNVKTSFQDQYGQSETEDAVRITMTKAAFGKFNWDELKYQSVWRGISDASDEYYLHPAIERNLNYDKLYLSI